MTSKAAASEAVVIPEDTTEAVPVVGESSSRKRKHYGHPTQSNKQSRVDATAKDGTTLIGDDGDAALDDGEDDNMASAEFEALWKQLVTDQPEVYTAKSCLLNCDLSTWNELLECSEFAWEDLKLFVSKWYCVRLGGSLWLSWTDVASQQEPADASDGATNDTPAVRLVPIFNYDCVRVYTNRYEKKPPSAVEAVLKGLINLIGNAVGDQESPPQLKSITIQSSEFLKNVMVQETDVNFAKVCIHNCSIPTDAQVSQWLSRRSNIFFRECSFETAGDDGGDGENGVSNAPATSATATSSNPFESLSSRDARLQRLVIWSPRGLANLDKIPFLAYAIETSHSLQDLEICDYDTSMGRDSWDTIIAATCKNNTLRKICFRGYRQARSRTASNNNNNDNNDDDNDDNDNTTNIEYDDWVKGLCTLIRSSHRPESKLFSITYHFSLMASNMGHQIDYNTEHRHVSDEETMGERMHNARQLWNTMERNGRISHLDLDWNQFDTNDDDEFMSNMNLRMNTNRQRNSVEVVANNAAKHDSMALLGRLLCHKQVRDNPECMFHVATLTNAMIMQAWRED